MSGAKHWCAYRFAPLAQLTDQAAPTQMPVRAPALEADRFQRDSERGYREGHASGMRNGFEAGIASGREEGRRKGEDEGRQEALQRFAGLAAPIDALLVQLQAVQADYQAALRKEVVELVAKVAREVIRAELELKPDRLLTLVDATLASMPRTPKKDVQVYLNTQDLERISSLDPKAIRRWNLSVDERLEPGECRVKAGNREVDAGCRQRLTACMEQISTQLLPDVEPPAAPL